MAKKCKDIDCGVFFMPEVAECEPIDLTCQPIDILVNGQEFATVISGDGQLNITVLNTDNIAVGTIQGGSILIGDSKYINSDGSFEQDILAEGIFVSPDIDIEIFDNYSNLLLSQTIPSNKDFSGIVSIDLLTTDTDRYGNGLPTILRNALNPNKDWNAHNFADTYLSLLTNPPIGAQEAAVFQFYQDMIDIGAYQKAYQIGLVIGGNADDHKWNARYPYPNIMSNPLVFVGSPAHTANGIETNGTTSGVFCNLFAWQLPPLNKQISIYKRNDIAPSSAAEILFGAGSSNSGIQLRTQSTGGLQAIIENSLLNTGITQYDGFLTLNSSFFARNGSPIDITNTSNTGFGFGVGGSFMSSFNTAFPVSLYRPSPVEFSYVYVGEALTKTQEADHYTAVQALQVALNRNV